MVRLQFIGQSLVFVLISLLGSAFLALPSIPQEPVLALRQTPIPALSPAATLNTRSGSASAIGSVSRGQKIYSFLGGQGDVIAVEVDVTAIHPGSLYTDDDSQVFLFDDQGRLLTNNDDFSGLESSIPEFILPQMGRYYLVVTTYNNDPLLNAERQVTGWRGGGGSAIEFTLSVTGLTRRAELSPP